MGIAKLMQDLLPYAEDCSLGTRMEDDASIHCVSSLVIDGPSFVYHVFNRQMRSAEILRTPMSHQAVNQSVVHMLDEMRSHGVDIERIYFDGALPLSKRRIRLDRLEKHRQALERFMGLQARNEIAGKANNRSQKDQSLLWQTTQSKALALKALEPPFMVPSAIEHLKQSVYASITEIIPDEAEMGCIAYASKVSVAVLSNDSDLVVFPAARNLSIVLLSTLDEFQGYSDTGKKILKAKYLMPSNVERRLQISSLHLLAFQRSLDPAASFGVIKQRAKIITVPGHENIDYDQFRAQYLFEISGIFVENRPQPNGILLDPRLSELHFQYKDSRHSVNTSTAIHMYLPSLFEEPTREAPWSHGANLRQLAYSLLNLAMPQELRRDHLVEFQRRGPRIVGVDVKLLKFDQIAKVFQSGLVGQYANSRNSETNIIAVWQNSAFQEVNRRRSSVGRAATLPTVHLRACIQAVLYSLRLVKQILELFHDRLATYEVMPTSIIELLATLPHLADLMDGIRGTEV